MPANKKPGGAPKNAVRSALVTAATIATLMGAQSLAFSQVVKDSQQPQVLATAAGTLASTEVSTIPAADSQPVVSATPLPSPLPFVAARVNGRNIPTSEVAIVAERSLKTGQVKQRPFAYRQAVNQLVIRELMLDPSRSYQPLASS